MPDDFGGLGQTPGDHSRNLSDKQPLFVQHSSWLLVTAPHAKIILKSDHNKALTSSPSLLHSASQLRTHVLQRKTGQSTLECEQTCCLVMV